MKKNLCSYIIIIIIYFLYKLACKIKQIKKTWLTNKLPFFIIIISYYYYNFIIIIIIFTVIYYLSCDVFLFAYSHIKLLSPILSNREFSLTFSKKT